MPKPRKSLISDDATPYYHCARNGGQVFPCALMARERTCIEEQEQRGKRKDLTPFFSLPICLGALGVSIIPKKAQAFS